MPIGTSKVGVFGAGVTAGGTETFNAPGTFVVPPGISEVNLTGVGSAGNPGNSGNPGNPGRGGGGGDGSTNSLAPLPAPRPSTVISKGNGGGPNASSGTSGNPGNPGTSLSSRFDSPTYIFPGGTAGNGGNGGNGGSAGVNGTPGGSNNIIPSGSFQFPNPSGSRQGGGVYPGGPPGYEVGGDGSLGGNSIENTPPSGASNPFPTAGPGLTAIQFAGSGGGGAGNSNPGEGGSPTIVKQYIGFAGGNSSGAAGGRGASSLSDLFQNNPQTVFTNATNGGNKPSTGDQGAGGGGGEMRFTDDVSLYEDDPGNPFTGRSLNTSFKGVGGSGGGGGSRGGNNTNPGGAGNAGSAATPGAYNAVPVTPGGSVPVVVNTGGQIVVTWNPQ